MSDTQIPDIQEALSAIAGDPYIAEAGIDEAFIEMFARNMNHFDKLPESTRKKISEQFTEMAGEKSYRTTVGHGKWDEPKSRAMAEWIQGVNLLLVMKKKGLA